MASSRNVIVAGLGIVVVDAVLWLLGTAGTISLAWALASVGIFTFLGVLLLGFTVRQSFEKDGIQLAILGSVLAVYFALAPVLVFVGVGSGTKDLATTFLGNMTAVVEVVVGFFAGSTTTTHLARAWLATRLTPQERTGLLKNL